MSDRLWSPQMRKWIKDADRHGVPIGVFKAKPNKYAGGEGGGIPYNLYGRITDAGDLRLTDDLVPRVTDSAP